MAVCLDKTAWKASASGKIDPGGGSIRVKECEVVFPPGAVSEPTQLEISIHHDHPASDDSFRISPVLTCNPPMRFQVAIRVSLSTWAITDQDHILFRIMAGTEPGDEREIGKQQLCDVGRTFTFDCDYLDRVYATIDRMFFQGLQFHLHTAAYYNESGSFVIVVNMFDHLIARRYKETMKENGFMDCPVMMNSLILEEGENLRTSVKFFNEEGFSFSPDQRDVKLDEDFVADLLKDFLFHYSPIPVERSTFRIILKVYDENVHFNLMLPK